MALQTYKCSVSSSVVTVVADFSRRDVAYTWLDVFSLRRTYYAKVGKREAVRRNLQNRFDEKAEKVGYNLGGGINPDVTARYKNVPKSFQTRS
jgi:hypothetical protein